MKHTEIITLKLGNFHNNDAQELLIHVDFTLKSEEGKMLPGDVTDKITITDIYIIFKDTIDDDNPTRIQLPTGLFTIPTLEYMATIIADNYTPVEHYDQEGYLNYTEEDLN